MAGQNRRVEVKPGKCVAERRIADALVDIAGEDSFPASDPPSNTPALGIGAPPANLPRQARQAPEHPAPAKAHALPDAAPAHQRSRSPVPVRRPPRPGKASALDPRKQ